MIRKRDLLYMIDLLKSDITDLEIDLANLSKEVDALRSRSAAFKTKKETARLKKAIKEITPKRKPGRPKKA